MRPVLFAWLGVRIYSYPAMLYVGLVAGIVVGNYAANVAHLNSARVLAATLLLLVPALAGARLLFVVRHWNVYRHEPRRIWRHAEGGAAMLGGLALAFAVSLAVLPALDLPLGMFWDVATFTMLVGMIPTRAGCLLHGCCSGRPTEGWFGVNLPDHRGRWRRRIPTQVLEAGLGIVLLVAAVAVWRRHPFPGAVFLTTVVGYSIGRLALEPTREVRDRYGSLDVQQAIAAALGVLALAGFLARYIGAPPHS
jgi:prolipoprotein diacylglyceryltransferase